MSNYHTTLRHARLCIISLCILLSAKGLAASSKYYGALQVQATPTGAGYVYASKDSTYSGEINDSVFVSEKAELIDEGSFTFYGYARPANDQCKFLGWTHPDDQLILSTDYRFQVDVPCIQNSDGIPNTPVYLARFAQPSTTGFSLTLVTSEHGCYEALANNTLYMVSTQPVNITQDKGLLSISLTPIPDDGYKFFAWYTLSDDGEKIYLSYQDSFDTFISEDITLFAEFVPVDTPLFQLPGSTKRYVGLEAALLAAGETIEQIILVSDGVLSGHHTIPAGKTLLIPYDNLFTCFKDTVRAIEGNNQIPPTPFRTLTLAPDATLDVQGAISLSACIWAPKSNGNPAGGVMGPYGCITTQEGSRIIVHDNAHLYCWGYIFGQGQVIAESGASIHEIFQFTGWRGGSATGAFANAGVFPINQYYVQNIECTLNIQHGAKEILASAVYASNRIQQASIALVASEQSLFVLKPETQLNRKYDSDTDRIQYSIQGNAALSSITVKLGGVLVYSDRYILPITNNMSVNVQSGTTKLEYDTALLPGAEISVASGATLEVADSAALILYDAEDWGPYADNGKELYPLPYLPTSTHQRTADELQDAQLHIDGNLIMNGFLYATEHGAHVTSNDGGVVLFHLGQGNLPYVCQGVSSTGTEEDAVATLDTIPLTTPHLENADGTWLQPTNEPSTYAFVPDEGVWKQIIIGDVNDDKTVNISDVTALVDIILGKRNGVVQGDINGDGTFDISDVTLLVNIILNK